VFAFVEGDVTDLTQAFQIAAQGSDTSAQVKSFDVWMKCSAVRTLRCS
jgi:hypothetical protein